MGFKRPERLDVKKPGPPFDSQITPEADKQTTGLNITLFSHTSSLRDLNFYSEKARDGCLQHLAGNYEEGAQGRTSQPFSRFLRRQQQIYIH